MLGKSLANPRTGLGRRLGAAGLVVLLTLCNQLEKQEGLPLPLVCPDILQNCRRFSILSDDDGTLPLLGARDELRGGPLERRDRFDILRGVHGTIYSSEFSACHLGRAKRTMPPPVRYQDVHCVYVLHRAQGGNLYTGYTADLRSRVPAPLVGKVRATRDLTAKSGCG